MSNAQVRVAIAEAVNTVDGLNVTPYYRQSLTPGNGCVRLASRGRDGSGYGYLDTWQVWLALPQDVAKAELWLDSNVDRIIEALSTQVVMVSVTPAELVLGGSNSTNGVIFEGAREDTP